MTRLHAVMTLVALPLLLSCGAEPKAEAGPIPPTSVGINLGSLASWGNERAFANLTAHSEWKTQNPAGGGWTGIPPEDLNPDGSVKALAEKWIAIKGLIRPAGPFEPLTIVCTYRGTAKFAVGGQYTSMRAAPGGFSMSQSWNPNLGKFGWITIQTMSAEDPVRDLDCRESTLAREATFAPEFIDFLDDFAAVRFLDWQKTNANHLPSWERMSDPGRTTQLGNEGVSVRLMVALANEANVDPWFMMPYRADDDYIRKFAQYVHDNLEPGRVAYVELGNEIWNYRFTATHQAQEEGVAAGLARKPFVALLRRYAQKSKNALQIWSSVFADDPKRLVRVVATQAVCTEVCFPAILDFEDTADSVDALAIAPYFAADTKKHSAATLDQFFTDLNNDIDRALTQAEAQKAIADRYGKRLIAYEGGQHVRTHENLELQLTLQRDPRMGAAYERYLSEWQRRIGDRMMLFNSAGPISVHGAWGLREYAGQPESEAPKLAATRRLLKRLSQRRAASAR